MSNGGTAFPPPAGPAKPPRPASIAHQVVSKFVQARISPMVTFVEGSPEPVYVRDVQRLLASGVMPGDRTTADQRKRWASSHSGSVHQDGEHIPCWDAIRLGGSSSDPVDTCDQRRCLAPWSFPSGSRAAERSKNASLDDQQGSYVWPPRAAQPDMPLVRTCIGDAWIRRRRGGRLGLLPGRSRAILTDHPGYHRTSSHQARAVTVASPQRSYGRLPWAERVVTARS